MAHPVIMRFSGLESSSILPYFLVRDECIFFIAGVGLIVCIRPLGLSLFGATYVILLLGETLCGTFSALPLSVTACGKYIINF